MRPPAAGSAWRRGPPSFPSALDFVNRQSGGGQCQRAAWALAGPQSLPLLFHGKLWLWHAVDAATDESALTMSTAAGAGHAPHALSPRQQTAVTNLQRHWRGLARRLHVLRKWSWAVSNRLENEEERHRPS